MRVFRSLSQVDSAAAGGALTIGNFDGMHLGHRRLISRAAQLARPVVVMTFEPHPMVVLNPRQAPPVLTPLDLKLDLLADAGADATLVMHSDASLLALGPESFICDMAVTPFRPRLMVEGPNFGFGRGRTGDVDMLRSLGRSHGFTVEVVPPVTRTLPGHHEPLVISSTLIRRLISGGTIEAAAECLGRPYRLIGKPVRGRGDGRRIGFPTVNLDVGEQLTPANGVYVGIARAAGKTWAAAISVGPAPTFEIHQPSVEAHLLDFTGELAAGSVALDLLARLRGIEKFDTVEQLVEQMRRDVELVRCVVGEIAGRQGSAITGQPIEGGKTSLA
jgi:riboflavin kinase/FMN adenylyltransferase